jgi:hypothetical protein
VRATRNDVLAWLAVPAAILWAISPLVLRSWDHVVDTRTLYPQMWQTIEPDIWLQMWILAWDAHILPIDPLSLFQANAFYPTPNVLARSDHLLGMLPLFGPVWWTTGNPVFAFQLTMVASYLVCGAAMYALLRHARCRRGVSAVVAVLWALMAFRLDDGLARAQLLQYQFLPLLVLFFDRWFELGRKRDLLLAALFLLWQTMTAYWHAYFAMYTAAVTMAVASMSPSTKGARRLGPALLAFAGVAAVLVATSLPYLEMSREGELVPKALPAKLTWYIGSASFPATIGLAMLAGVAAALAPRSDSRMRRLAVCFGLVAIAGVLLSLGSAPESASVLERLASLPRQLATAVVPGFRYLRDEYRFLTLASLGIYGLAAIGLDALYRRAESRSAFLAAAALAAFAIVSGAPIARRSIPLVPAIAASQPPPVYAWLAEHGGGGTVLELPISKNLSGAWREAQYMFFSTYHWLPLINGYTGHPPRAWYDRMRGLATKIPDIQSTSALVEETGLRWIVVHDEAKEAAALWKHSPNLRQVGSFDGAELFEVQAGRPPQAN